MAIIQRLRHFGDPPGPPASLGQPGQMAISIPSTGLAQLYIANNAGSWESFLDMWRNQPMGLAGLEASGKLLAAVIPQATEGAMGGAMIATQAEVNGELEDTKIVTAAKMAAYIAAQGVVVVPATETIEGIARYATQTEVNAGVLTTTTVRPSTLKPLADRVTTAEGDITELFGRMVGAETNITSLDGRLTTAETNIAANTANIATNTADIAALDSRLDTAETSITTLQGRTGTATTAVQGIARLATQSEVNAGTAGALIVTPETLSVRLSAITAPDASEVVKGIAELATTAEVTTGTDDLRIVTPLKLAQRIAAIPAVPTATETVAGIAEIATQAEVNTGTDDSRIVTPLKLKTAYVAKAGDTMTGTLTIQPAASAAILDLRSPAGQDPALRMGAGGFVRAQWGWSPAQSIAYLNINDAAGAYVWTALSANATGVGIGGIPGYRFEVKWPSNDVFIAATADGPQNAGLLFRNNQRFYGWSVDVSGHAIFSDYTSSVQRLSIVPASNVIVKDRGDGYAALQLLATTQLPILYFTRNARQWNLNVDGSGNFSIVDNTAGAQRFFIDTGGNIGVSTIYASGTLRGGAGGAGCLTGHTNPNLICFRWDGTNVYARIDEVIERVIG